MGLGKVLTSWSCCKDSIKKIIVKYLAQYLACGKCLKVGFYFFFPKLRDDESP